MARGGGFAVFFYCIRMGLFMRGKQAGRRLLGATPFVCRKWKETKEGQGKENQKRKKSCQKKKSIEITGFFWMKNA